jgi:hypothetical protein
MLDHLWSALALVFVIEGIFPFLSPGGLRRAVLAVSQMSDGALRFVGLSSMLIGLLLLNLVS